MLNYAFLTKKKVMWRPQDLEIGACLRRKKRLLKVYGQGNGKLQEQMSKLIMPQKWAQIVRRKTLT
jgi:hypothetical protein